MKYIQLGEKKKGRFVKSEQLSLKEFKAKILDTLIPTIPDKEFSFIDKMLGKHKQFEREYEQYIKGFKDTKSAIMTNINNIIDKDEKGKRTISKKSKKR
jgi:2-phosphoglycerate kinase